jgi:hypothetical protein
MTVSIVVTGSPGSGKTLTAVKIATALADFRRKVILICCDEQVPAVPLLIPGAADGAPSLGSLLRLPRISPVSALRHCIPFGKSGLIGLLGYRIGDQSPPEGCESRVVPLLSTLRNCADYIVSDCSLENCLAGPLLNDCDICFRLLNAGLKSFIYFEAHRELLKCQFQAVNILNNLKPYEDPSLFGECLGSISCELPHVQVLDEQFSSGRLSEPAFGDSARQYHRNLYKMVVQELLSQEN